jgi:hypothetical protein
MQSRILLAVLCVTACSRPAPPVPLRSSPPRDYEALVRALYADEPDFEKRWPIEFKVRVVEGLLQDLQREALDLGMSMGAPYFVDSVELGWADLGAAKPSAIADGITKATWVTEAPRRENAADVAGRFRGWLGSFRFVERAVFKAKGAHDSEEGGLDATVAIELAGAAREGGLRRDAALADVRFRKLNGAWRIVRFLLRSGETQRAPAQLFEDVTDSWLAGVSAPSRATLRTRSRSDELHRVLLDDKHPPPPSLDHLLPLAMDTHPGVAVADLDGDGFDDLFVWDVGGPAVVLHNESGHGFTEATDHYGLDVADVSAAAFADLDGDGTLDAVIGHWFTPSEIRFGAGGRFWPGSAGRFHLPAQVASISLADIDGDGRLDIFFATAAHDFHGHLAAALDGNPELLARLDENERRALEEALPAARAARAAGQFDINTYQFGPRDVVLLNRGDGRFVDATATLGLLQYRNTLQAAFADVDGDGAPDLFLANDFAPAAMYLQRGGRFVDVSSAAGADRIFFGMGASFGDFDNDGDLDLYATAMQSSAGARIMSDAANFSPEHDPAARRARLDAARGNTLLRNDGGGSFTDLTALPAFADARHANWAYSAQLVDLDGDGWLDVFSPNGFFTSSLSPDDPFVRDL